MSEPIQDCRDANEIEEGLGEFVVARGDATVDFDPTEEVLDLMAAAIAIALGRDAVPSALSAEARPEDISIQALVGHDSAVARAGRRRQDRMLMLLLRLGSEAERHIPSASIDDCGQFGIQPAFGAAHRLSQPFGHPAD